MMYRSILNGKLFYCLRTVHGEDIGLFDEKNMWDYVRTCHLKFWKKYVFFFVKQSILKYANTVMQVQMIL